MNYPKVIGGSIHPTSFENIFVSTHPSGHCKYMQNHTDIFCYSCYNRKVKNIKDELKYFASVKDMITILFSLNEKENYIRYSQKNILVSENLIKSKSQKLEI